MAGRRHIEDLIAQLLRHLKPKARSIIVTVYGDSIMPHGGSAWLGSLIRLLAPLGLNERTVRTSVFRLAKEDWLAAEQVGRRSYYRLTESGRRRTDAAHARIFQHASHPWDRHWTVVVCPFAAMTDAHRKALRDDLRWQGFGQLASGIMLHPDPDAANLRRLLEEAGAARQTLVLRGKAETLVAPEAVREIIGRCWDMQRLAADYAAFLDLVRPLREALDATAERDPQTCFVVRTLLMHAYRRVLLRDPKLPDELLAADWPGTAARHLCRDLYKLVQGAAEQHLMAELLTAQGPAPAAHPSYYARFGGLTAGSAAA